MPQQRGRTVRDAKADFFENDAVEDPGQALVRESIQNALDARRRDLPDDEPVRVAFRFAGSKVSAVADRTESLLLDDLRPHLTAERNGLRKTLLTKQPPRWLIVEDEGTVGLTGDPGLSRQPPADRTDEHYYHFVWAEGQTNKGAGARGSHGVGKMVFSLASQARTTLIYTRRVSDDRELIVGRCHLRHHVVDNDYCDNGFFGDPDRDGFTRPLDARTDPSSFEAIRQAVGFASRDDGRTGLSVAMLWPDSEITPEAIRQAVCGEWFESILSRRLVVTIDDGTGPAERIDAGSFDRLVQSGSVASHLADAINLARYRHRTKPVELKLTQSTQSKAWKWSDAREEGLLDEVPDLRHSYLDGETIHVRVPVVVPSKLGETERLPGHFDVVLRRVQTDKPVKLHRPWFLREGIHISDVTRNAKRSTQYRAIVAIDGGPVAAMLRTSENPAHTQWLRQKLKSTYTRGCLSCLEFVQSAAESLHQSLVASDQEKDVFALASFFGVAGQGLRDKGEKETPAKPSDASTGTKQKVVINAAPKPHRIERFIEDGRGGLRIASTPQTLGLVEAGQPLVIDVELAYDVNRGDPMKRHSLADFDLREIQSKADPKATRLGLSYQGSYGKVSVSRVKPNSLRLSFREPRKAFDFRLFGFDSFRDLLVKATVVDGLRTTANTTDPAEDDPDDMAGSDLPPPAASSASPAAVGAPVGSVPTVVASLS